jgi:hypothetical protein
LLQAKHGLIIQRRLRASAKQFDVDACAMLETQRRWRQREGVSSQCPEFIVAILVRTHFIRDFAQASVGKPFAELAA